MTQFLIIAIILRNLNLAWYCNKIDIVIARASMYVLRGI